MSDGGGGSALAVVLDASRSEPAASPDLQKQQAFSQRMRDLRGLMQDVCGRGGGKASDFDAAFGKVQALWDAGTWEGAKVEEAFQGVETKLAEAEDVIAAKLEQEAQLIEQRGAFSERVTGLRHRAGALVGAGAATWEVFDAGFKKLEGLFGSDQVTGEKAEQALTEMDTQIGGVEARVEASERYKARRAVLDTELSKLKANKFLPPGALEKAEQLFGEAATIAGGQEPDRHTAALKKLDEVASALGRAQKKADEEEDIFNNQGTLLEGLCTRNFPEGPYKGITPDQILESLTEEQISELVHMEQDAQKIKNDSKRKAKRREIRDRFAEIMQEVKAAAAADEEDEEEAPAEETAEERRKRIHELKLRFKSASALMQLADAGEIYSTREVFANRGSNFGMGVGSISDWVAGYDVYLRNGPDPKGKMTQYRKMVVHFHFSDNGMTKIERGHFKNSHAAADKSHVLLKTAEQDRILRICRGQA